MKTENVVLTNMCMINNRDDKVLVQDRVSKDWGGLTFPGGKVEPGESFVDSVIREVKEETGLTIAKPKICGTKDWVMEDGTRYLVIFYKTDQYKGELKSSKEGQVKWMTIEELKKGPLADGMEDMLRVFLEDELSESHYVEKDGVWTCELK